MDRKDLYGLIRRTQRKVEKKIEQSKEEDLTKLNEEFAKEINKIDKDV